MRRSLSLVLVLGLTLGATTVVAAEDLATYDTEGDAQVTARDPRVAALDEAFARGVTLALAELVATDVRAARKADLDREFIVRARIWIKKFSVTSDTTKRGQRQLQLTMRIDRDQLRGKLAELNVPVMTVTEASRGRSVVILLRLAEPSGVRASFGSGAEKDIPGLGAISSVLRARGMSTKRPPASGPPVGRGGDLPVDDDQAEALASTAGADLAAIAGITVGAPVAVRGLPGSAMLVTGRARLIERRGGREIGHGMASVASRGTDPQVVERAVELAVGAALGDVMPPAPRAMTQASGFTGDDVPVGEPGVVLVRLAPRTPWGIVLAELKHLSGAKGIKRAVLRRLSPAGWVIGVTTTESTERIARIAKQPPATDTAVKVRISGEIVDVSLSGSP